MLRSGHIQGFDPLYRGGYNPIGGLGSGAGPVVVVGVHTLRPQLLQ